MGGVGRPALDGGVGRGTGGVRAETSPTTSLQSRENDTAVEHSPHIKLRHTRRRLRAEGYSGPAPGPLWASRAPHLYL
jgi:hypothetical protein